MTLQEQQQIKESSNLLAVVDQEKEKIDKSNRRYGRLNYDFYSLLSDIQQDEIEEDPFSDSEEEEAEESKLRIHTCNINQLQKGNNHEWNYFYCLEVNRIINNQDLERLTDIIDALQVNVARMKTIINK